MAATIALIGNPNCGKTTIFNGLTGANQRVGNWPGVTVERKEGSYWDRGLAVTVVDLPGVYALDAEDSGLDEQIARKFLLAREYDLVVNILDAANLERNFYLTSQLLDLEVPLLLVLNMMDVAHAARINIHPETLSQRLSLPVLPFCAKQKQYFEQLRQEIRTALKEPQLSPLSIPQPSVIEEAIADLLTQGAQNRMQALVWLQYAESVSQEVIPPLRRWRQRIHQTLGEDIDLIIADSRYRWIQSLMADVLEQRDRLTTTVSDRIDRIVLNRWLGIPIFLAVMYSVFLISINVGGAFIDFFDIGVGTLVVGWPTQILATLNAPGWLIGLLAEGVGGGIQTTATFIPQIGLLFIFLTLLEDSGYLARAAFVMDRLMRWMGLPGKSFLPMMISFGCNIPGIMATRTLENRRDRLMTILMNPFMSCGARLPVYALFVAAFFPRNGQNLVFLLYILGIAAAIFTGFLMKHTLFQGEMGPFVMELPRYHLPTFQGVLLRAWERLKTFIVRAGKMIVICVALLSLCVGHCCRLSGNEFELDGFCCGLDHRLGLLGGHGLLPTHDICSPSAVLIPVVIGFGSGDGDGDHGLEILGRSPAVFHPREEVIVLLQLQEYIRNRQIVSLRELATHFRAPPAAIEPILDQLIRKGRVQKVASRHCGGCNQCSSETFELYQWGTSNAIRSNDKSTQ